MAGQAFLTFHDKNSLLVKAIGSDFKGRVSVIIYAIALLVTFINSWVAFALYGMVALIWILKPEKKEKLKSILEHHAAAPAYNPEILSSFEAVDVVDGPKLKIKVKNGKIFVEDVEVKAAIAAKNGIIYVVDTVILAK